MEEFSKTSTGDQCQDRKELSKTDAFDLLASSKVEECCDLELLSMPSGFRFLPEDNELVLYYLTNKILKRPFPVDIIITLPDLYRYDPNMLVHEKDDGTKNEVFYFTQVREEHKRNIVSVVTGDWVQCGTETAVYHGSTVIGFRKDRFFRLKTAAPIVSGDTVWVVNEFRLNIDVVPQELLNDNMRKQVDRWVVCRIFKIIAGANSESG